MDGSCDRFLEGGFIEIFTTARTFYISEYGSWPQGGPVPVISEVIILLIYRGPITPRLISGKGPTLWCTNSISFLFQHLGRIGKTVAEHQVLLSQKSGSPPRMMIIPLFRQGFNHPRWWSPDFWTINSMVYPIPQPGNWDALEESWRILCKEIHRKSSARKIWKESRNTNMFQVGGKYIPRKDCHVF